MGTIQSDDDPDCLMLTYYRMNLVLRTLGERFLSVPWLSSKHLAGKVTFQIVLIFKKPKFSASSEWMRLAAKLNLNNWYINCICSFFSV